MKRLFSDAQAKLRKMMDTRSNSQQIEPEYAIVNKPTVSSRKMVDANAQSNPVNPMAWQSSGSKHRLNESFDSARPELRSTVFAGNKAKRISDPIVCGGKIRTNDSSTHNHSFNAEEGLSSFTAAAGKPEKGPRNLLNSKCAGNSMYELNGGARTLGKSQTFCGSNHDVKQTTKSESSNLRKRNDVLCKEMISFRVQNNDSNSNGSSASTASKGFVSMTASDTDQGSGGKKNHFGALNNSINHSNSFNSIENEIVGKLEDELQHSKQIISALKDDMKKLKAEKFDLIGQLKQMYATLESKERELRDFIRNFEQKIRDSDEQLKILNAEREQLEREKWSILKHARDESERTVSLCAQLGLKEAQLQQTQVELTEVKRCLSRFIPSSTVEEILSNCSKLNGHAYSSQVLNNSGTPVKSPSPYSSCSQQQIYAEIGNPDGINKSASRSNMSVISTPNTEHNMALFAEGPSSMPADGLSQGEYDSTSIYAPLSACGDTSSSSGVNPNNLASFPLMGLSRSAEELPHILMSQQDIKRLAESRPALPTSVNDQTDSYGTVAVQSKSKKMSGLAGALGAATKFGSISRVFARNKNRKSADSALLERKRPQPEVTWSSHHYSLVTSPLAEETFAAKVKLVRESKELPIYHWKAPMVLAWLEIELGMPQYGFLCVENVKSGKVLLELNDTDLEVALGITNVMHVRKLRLAIEELRRPKLQRYPLACDIHHSWVSGDWLPTLGLSQFAENFACNLVDGRMLDYMGRKDLEKYLVIENKFYQLSILHGIQLLRIMGFDRQLLHDRRSQSENGDFDPLVWTNQRFMKWIKSIDLEDFAANLVDSGVHGALAVLEPSFTGDTLAAALGIPLSKNIIRRHLSTELAALVQPARLQLQEGNYDIVANSPHHLTKESKYSMGSLSKNFIRSVSSPLSSFAAHKSQSFSTNNEASAGGSGTQPNSSANHKAVADVKDKSRSSLRGSISRALGLKVKHGFLNGNAVRSHNNNPSRLPVAQPRGKPVNRSHSSVCTSSYRPHVSSMFYVAHPLRSLSPMSSSGAEGETSTSEQYRTSTPNSSEGESVDMADDVKMASLKIEERVKTAEARAESPRSIASMHN